MTAVLAALRAPEGLEALTLGALALWALDLGAMEALVNLKDLAASTVLVVLALSVAEVAAIAKVVVVEVVAVVVEVVAEVPALVCTCARVFCEGSMLLGARDVGWGALALDCACARVCRGG